MALDPTHSQESNALPHQTPAKSSDTVPTRAVDPEGFSSSPCRNGSWARFCIFLVTQRILCGRDHVTFAVSVLPAAATESFGLQIIQNTAFLGNFSRLHGCGAELTPQLPPANFCSLFSWTSNEKLPKHSKLFECTHSLCQSTAGISNALIRLEN